eukprot:CAMPEP_0172562584 /NCGR_PEP_ID=MMETSP1067-20121228/97442_1 /TAXON_ID=265564 ORGANISM="Thalassiosira punctigera, Strain Tpunct2005C2" /NCGR_SAMPLE_ID=MMETSP1067 /ASSEMBLY_ACC=CAM_ASM_000444 /LENGTH=74 /DNA_ID=CAMNT_0013352827 /DNA_START=1 /DNA_END=222 /DNA_ORIENTATION=-
MADPQDGSVAPIASVPAKITIKPVVERRLGGEDHTRDPDPVESIIGTEDDGATDSTVIPVLNMNDDRDGGATDP